MFERFTDRARRVLVLAQDEARQLRHSFIGTEHILLGLSREDDGVAAKALSANGISHETIRSKVVEMVQPGSGEPLGSPPFTPRAKKVLELALRQALQLGHHYIGTEHMLLGLMQEGEGVAAQALKSLGADSNALRQTILELVKTHQSESRRVSSETSFSVVLRRLDELKQVIDEILQRLKALEEGRGSSA